MIFGWVLAAVTSTVVIRAYRRCSRDADYRAERRYDAFISASSIWIPLAQFVGATVLAIAAGVVTTVVFGWALGVPLLIGALACTAGAWYMVRILRTAAPMPDMLDDSEPEATAG